MNRSGIRIKQHDITDCGAACLASVSAFYRLHLPLSKIRQFAHTDQKGTNILGLLEAAQKLGFDAKGVRGDKESLFQIPKPSIVHLIVKGTLQHYVVLYKVSRVKVQIMDPAKGEIITRTIDDFMKEWTGVLVILLPGENFVPGNEKVSIFSRFWFLLRPHKYILIQALIGSVFYTLLGFTTSIYIQKITDHVLVNGNLKLLNIMSVLMILLLMLQMCLSVFKDVFLIRTGQEIDARLILGYYRHLLKLPQQFFDSMRVGEIISRINDAVKIRMFINNTSLSLMVNFFIVLFSFSIMFAYYWKLGLLMLCLIPVYALIYLFTNYFNKKTERKIMESSAELESQLVESLNSMSTVKQFGLEDLAHEKTEIRFITLLRSGYRSSINHVFSQASTQGISSLFTILLLWAGSYYVLAKELTPGELLSFYVIAGYFTSPVSGLISSNKSIQNAFIAADRLFEIMDIEREASINQYPLPKVCPGDICFKNVTFGYGARETIFKDFNLSLQQGEISAIVGESGSGKSTLIHLLQHLYAVKRGSIFIGDHNLAYIEKRSLKDLISVVPQKIHLFAGTVTENIAVGCSRIDMKKLLDISKMLGMLHFIENLPHGINTYLGEDGTTLSGGQKQRIAIARALYKDPSILILDEATSSLDSTAEKFVLDTITNFREKGHTVILISHRLSSLVQADRIFYLYRGKVIEKGRHSQLISKKGPYQKLWEKQFPKACFDQGKT
jgi:ATP-binding cassette subfamily B protein